MVKPRGTDSVRIIQVIETKSVRGSGESLNDVCRQVTQYWDMDGNLLSENDPQPNEEIKLEHDGCKGCKYIDKANDEYPCNTCKQNYKDQWNMG